MAKGLTAKEEIFLEGLKNGKTAYQAYLDAYPRAANWSRDVVDSKASHLKKKGKIKARFSEWKAEKAKANEVSRDAVIQQVKGLAFIDVNPANVKETDMIRYKLEALKLLSKICGFDEPGQVSGEMAGEDPRTAVLEQIREAMAS